MDNQSATVKRFNSTQAWLVIRKSIFLGTFSGLVGSVVTGLLVITLTTWEGILAGIAISIPAGTVYGLINGIALAVLLWRDSLSTGWRSWTIGARIYACTICVTIVISAATMMVDELGLWRMYLLFGQPATICAAIWSGNKIRKWYVDWKLALAETQE